MYKPFIAERRQTARDRHVVVEGMLLAADQVNLAFRVVDQRPPKREDCHYGLMLIKPISRDLPVHIWVA